MGKETDCIAVQMCGWLEGMILYRYCGTASMKRGPTSDSQWLHCHNRLILFMCPYVNIRTYIYISHQHVPDVYTVHVHMFLKRNITVKD